ncbi:MAG: ribokinase [Leptolyngbyaceae cyanobacterium]
MTIVVFGSLNMDLVVRSPRLPQPGETLLGTTFETVPGGKGANQAVAAARLGATTHLIGRVGADDFGHRLRHGLAVAIVGADGSIVDNAALTGVASLTVAANGSNQIVVVPGANGRVDHTDIAHLKPYLAEASALLMQFEIPLATVTAAAQLAHDAGVTVIVDPAPAPAEFPAALYQHTDILTPNQIEASQLLGSTIETIAQARQAAQVLQQRGVGTVIITLGGQGVVCATATEVFEQPAFAIEVVDTVAAGDAFNGGLAVALAEGKPRRAAISWASATAALTVTQPGAQPALPTRSQVEAFLANPPQH